MTDDLEVLEGTMVKDVKSLWQNQPTETQPMSLEQVHQRALKFQNMQKWKFIVLGVEVGLIVLMTTFVVVKFEDAVLRVAYLLVMLGALFLFHYSYANRESDPKAVASASQACFDFYKASLSRRIRLLETSWAWALLPVLPGAVLLFYRTNQIVDALHPAAGNLAVDARTIVNGAEIIGLVAIAGALAFWRWRASRLRRELQDLGGQPGR